jgi:hypothetical protein
MLAGLLLLSALLAIGFTWQILWDAFSGTRVARHTWNMKFAGLGAGYGLGATVLMVHFLQWHGVFRLMVLSAGVIGGASLGIIAFDFLIKRTHPRTSG